jgi:hypothetical protein
MIPTTYANDTRITMTDTQCIRNTNKIMDTSRITRRNITQAFTPYEVRKQIQRTRLFTSADSGIGRSPLPAIPTTYANDTRITMTDTQVVPAHSTKQPFLYMNKGYNGMPLHVMEQPPRFFALAYRASDACIYQ